MAGHLLPPCQLIHLEPAGHPVSFQKKKNGMAGDLQSPCCFVKCIQELSSHPKRTTLSLLRIALDGEVLLHTFIQYYKWMKYGLSLQGKWAKPLTSRIEAKVILILLRELFKLHTMWGYISFQGIMINTLQVRIHEERKYASLIKSNYSKIGNKWSWNSLNHIE